MMIGTHVVIAGASWAGACAVMGWGVDPLGLGLAAAGAALPDLDTVESWAGRRVYPLALVLNAALGHRGGTHSIWPLVLGLAYLFFGGSGYAIPVLVGFAAHLAADFCTDRGIPLFWPWGGRFGVHLCRTNSPGEYLIGSVAGLVMMAAYGLL